MKTVTKMFVIIALTAVIVFSITTCINQQKPVESSYVGGTLKVTHEQVWERTNDPEISKAYEKSTITGDISIVTLAEDEIGTGDIQNGFLNFSVGNPGTENLSTWDVLKEEFYEWKNVTIDAPDTVGNVITLITDTGKMLGRERLYGTDTKLGLESIIYVYVNKDCKITGEYNDVSINGYYTATILDLSFKRGWNLLCRREFFDIDGRNAVTMEIKQPVDFRWVILP
jgi:hypothetical protein